MNPGEIEDLLEKWGFGWQRGTHPSLWWIGAIGEKGEYQIRLHLDPQRLLLAHTLSERAVRLEAEVLLLFLEANNRMTVAKMALDELGRPLLIATWPAAYLTADNLGFLITNLVDHIDRFRDDVVAQLVGGD